MKLGHLMYFGVIFPFLLSISFQQLVKYEKKGVRAKKSFHFHLLLAAEASDFILLTKGQ